MAVVLNFHFRKLISYASQCFDYILSNYNKLGLKLPKMPIFLEKREKRKNVT